MDFQVTLEHFSGPLDLMLYLIKDKKLDLFELNIEALADQYIHFISSASEQKLDIATEYISELSGLVEYKSKRLLPRDKSLLDADDVADDENDLVKRLIEYQRYKEVSLELAERFEERSKQFSKPLSSNLFKSIKKSLNDSITYEQTPYDLMNAMSKVLQRFQLSNPMDVQFESKELSIDDVIDDLRITFRGEMRYELDDLLMRSRTIQHAIVTFLAVLDMIRMGEIKLNYQEELIFLKGAY